MFKPCSKICILLAVVLVVVAGFFIWRLFRTTEEISSFPPTLIGEEDNNSSSEVLPAADWNTYTNEEFSFEFKYPDSISRKSNSTWVPDDPNILKVLTSVFTGEPFILRIVVNGRDALATSMEAELLDEKTINITGIEEKIKTFKEPDGRIISIVSLERNSKSYVIWAEIESGKEDNLTIFNQLLSAFKFF